VNGEPTIVRLGTVTRTCFYKMRCCCYPPPPCSWTRVHVDGPSPRIVEGGPGGQSSVGLAALTLVAYTLASAALAAIAAMIVTLSLTLIAIAMGMRLSRRRSRGVVGVERMRGRRGCVRAEHELL
jgi:hypothetical protein